MKNQFIQYRQSLKLKELGFDEECLASYPMGSKIFIGHIMPVINSKCKSGSITAPLWQQAFDWFRKKYDYNISIYGRKSMGYDFKINNIPGKNGIKDTLESKHVWKTYEEARHACLEKLIELCKNH